MTTSIPYLSDKQMDQILNLSKKTQSFLCSDTSTFAELLKIASRTSNDLCLKRVICEFKTKYYPKGYKENKRTLSKEQKGMVFNFYQPRFGNPFKPYKDMERTAFMRVVRACRDYLYSGMSEEDTDKLVNRIVQSYKLVTN